MLLRLTLFFLHLCLYSFLSAQTVPIQDYAINSFGQVQLEIEGEADKYYLLTAKHEPNLNYESITSMTLGVDGPMIISEPLAAYLQQNYKITAHSIADPDDTDGDGIDDITEFNNRPNQSPLNYAQEVPLIDGTTAITSLQGYSNLAVVSEDIPWAPFLNDREFVKFAIVNQGSDEPEIYFINSQTHNIHADFLMTINVDQFADDVVTGEIVHNPNEVLPNGVIGSFSFNYSFGDAEDFELTQKTFELLATNMPFLQNNMNHFIGDFGEDNYNTIYKNGFVGSRLNVVLESEFFADIDYLPMHKAEGYGLFRHMQLDENPGSRDIVLYDVLPNSLPRVGGIITSVVQTPLSHVNLRAIQDNVPNAYIKQPLAIDSIAQLIGKYIYYRVEQDEYQIREASLDEVNEWYEKLRPTEEQIPERDLSQTEILALDSIEFSMSTAFGAKCSNVATMRTFGFVDGTIPDGFGIPFYYYDAFMEFNGFYEKAETMISDPIFITDLEVRIDRLKDFRKEIKAADMPQWMLDNLDDMHKSFPVGTAVRCRSSTNNEDLPGFSGAGLYTSKTQHLDEGHISKSIKQVYASMWNFRAYEEREFYRVDHKIAAMGVLCHPNYQEEKSNGVGVSLDPIFNTLDNYYLNTQVGEFLITNPDANSIPEEILLNREESEGYLVLRRSNLAPVGQLIMTDDQINQLRDHLTVIHDAFAILYNVVGAEGFGMDIEYKVTSANQLIIKQARPWVSFWSDIKANFDLAAEDIIDPQSSSTLGDTELVTASIANRGLRDMSDFEISLLVDDQLVETITVLETLSPQTVGEYTFTIPQDFSVLKDYDLQLIVSHANDGFSGNDTLRKVLSKLHLLDGALTASSAIAKCQGTLDARVTVTNLGETTFSSTEIEVEVNGLIIDTVYYNFSIPYLAEAQIEMTLTENLQELDNDIVMRLLRVNGTADAVSSNNAIGLDVDLTSDYDIISFVVEVDDYPEENAWLLYDIGNDKLVASGVFLEEDFIEEICVDYGSCLRLRVTDRIGDGICCDFGIGKFYVLNASGDTLVSNNGVFDREAEEIFCPNGEGCSLAASVMTSNASAETEADGTITINPIQGIAPYAFSIDGGMTFVDTTFFENLAAGIYNIVVTDASNDCLHEETIELKFDTPTSLDEIFVNSIKVYPNPTDGDFVLKIENATNLSENMLVEIYNSIGQIVDRSTVLISDQDVQASFSLENQRAGTYIVRCRNGQFDHYFKVIKF